MPDRKRFRVALSFPGERRPFVEAVARRLAERVGKDRVFYDADYQAELARPDLDTYLQAIYRDESELIAVFLDADYECKEWCGLEWRVLRDLIKRRQGLLVMPFRFDDTEIPGLLSIDGYVEVADRSPEEVAELIVARLAINDRAAGRAQPPAAPRRAPTRLTHSATTLFGRETDLAWLDAAWDKPDVHVATLVAWGGVGKTSLVAKWAAGLAADPRFAGADYFDWSFYSQGVRETGGASADAFVSKALTFFGDPAMAASPAAPHDKGARLAELVARRRALLVLDGLEPLQYPPGPLAGQLTDPALAALLKGLAMTNTGLCVVTTRVRVSDLDSFRDGTAPERQLGKLSTAAGVALLEKLGVHGHDGLLEELVEDVDGHALTLQLLGRYLARAHAGDVRRRDRVALSRADRAIQGGHAFKAMAAYEAWLGESGEDGSGKDGARQLAVLRLLGLFDRPASHDCLEALRREPALPRLGEALVGLDADAWNLTLADLTDHGLVTRLDDPHGELIALDAHPLIREYFARQLQEHADDTWRAAQGRLFDHLCETTEHQPDTLEGLQPLYQAVAHGCWAGREQEACENVYHDRILRGTGDDGFYSTRKLGALGADLGAVGCFFEAPWSQVSPRLSAAGQAWLLNEAASRLRGLGRLREALEPMRAGLERAVERENWKSAAVRAGNLSELELTLGEVGKAHRDARQAVDFANRSSDAFWRMATRTTLADALFQAGQTGDASELFRQAETLQAEHQPSNPLLYSLQGFQYCDLLLAGAERAAWGRVLEAREGGGHGASGLLGVCGEVEGRATQALAIATQHNWLLDSALGHLTLARAGLYRALLAAPDPPGLVDASVLEGPGSELDTAVDGLRRAGQQQFVPLGLLTRAWLRFLAGDPEAARADLDEAWDIATAGPMPLFQADVQLHRARLFRDRRALAEARRLIAEHGYDRRLGELEDTEAVTEGWDGR